MATLREVAERAQDCSAGLQIFLDNIRLRDTGIRESVHEFVLLDKGFLQLQSVLGVTQCFTPALRDDINLLMKSMNLTMDRVQRMFGETKNLKLDGKRPFKYVWDALCNDFNENQGGIDLLSRLQLYSMFLTQILTFLSGQEVARITVTKQRDTLQRLLLLQAPPPPPPPPRRPAVDPLQTFPMPGAFPFVPEAPSPFATSSASTSSTGSWDTFGSSQAGSSMGSLSRHWATEIFNGQHPTTRFPRRLRENSVLCGKHEPRLSEHLSRTRCCLLAQVFFEVDGIEARFYCAPNGRENRLILMQHDATTRSMAQNSLIKRLKVKRQNSSLWFWRMDRTGVFVLWAKLCFVEIERLVLFYSTFVALKGQDIDPEEVDLIHNDYYSVKEEYLYGGTTLYPTVHGNTLKHALRVFQDKYTKAIRIEARALRGNKQNIPIWVAFLPPDLRARGWIRPTAPRQVELRVVQQYVFVGGYVPTFGRNGRFLIDFQTNGDAEDFIRVMKEQLAD